MIKNERKMKSTEEVDEIAKKYTKNAETCLMIVDGEKVKNKDEYFAFLKQHLQISEDSLTNKDAYLDVMRDLYSYNEKDEILILIYNYESFLSGDEVFKKFVEDTFDQVILPFFEEEIERCVVGGAKTKYNIYYSL